ncbi:MAG TPA: CidA/LrgA family protein [Spirochaetia bacterium]|nr:CidA/LrgA family protein [Spirochaetia bacterium]
MAPLFGGLVTIFVALAAGDLVHSAGVPVPGSVLGMVLLAVALAVRITRPAQVRPAANILTRNMSILFVPAGVGVMTYADTIARAWLPILLAIVASTTLVLVITGPLQQRLQRRLGTASAKARRGDSGDTQ